MIKKKSTDHIAVRCCVELLIQHGVEKAIISPGSRNAPFVMALTQQNAIETLSITDERSAGFFALGMAQQSQKAVALICTSGTAVLNYAPAIAEAFYQKIPLFVISADRPENLIDQAEGQTIRQNGVLANHVAGSYTFFVLKNEKELPFYIRRINEAILLAQQKSVPVHLNFHLEEPLYETKVYKEEVVRKIQKLLPAKEMSKGQLEKLAGRWNTSEKVMLLTGFLNNNSQLQKAIFQVSDNENVAVFSENISNLHGKSLVTTIDRVVSTISEKEAKDFIPDILITFGGVLVSKMMKSFLRKHSPKEHWHIGMEENLVDTYEALSLQIPIKPASFFAAVVSHITKTKSTFNDIWQERKRHVLNRHQKFVQKCEWSDLKAFDIILEGLPEKSDLQLGNSTVVRYAQLFNLRSGIRYFSNRGTSGIEGSISTAAGAAYISKKLTTAIVGDLSFLYDSNALWNNYLPHNLKIIVINNGGGGIFRFISGPDKSGYLKTFFEASHEHNFKKLAKQFKLNYYLAGNEKTLTKLLKNFYADKKTSILEIDTPREKNAEVLKKYFKSLKDK